MIGWECFFFVLFIEKEGGGGGGGRAIIHTIESLAYGLGSMEVITL